MALGLAMTQAQILEAIHAGMDVPDAQADENVDLVATRDMGIGDTTASSAITAEASGSCHWLLHGDRDEQRAYKIGIIERALAGA